MILSLPGQQRLTEQYGERKSQRHGRGSLQRFRVKWGLVRVKKTRQNKKLEYRF
jgi:hypothetical protein